MQCHYYCIMTSCLVKGTNYESTHIIFSSSFFLSRCEFSNVLDLCSSLVVRDQVSTQLYEMLMVLVMGWLCRFVFTCCIYVSSLSVSRSGWLKHAPTCASASPCWAHQSS
jgi:hypothetical protein